MSPCFPSEMHEHTAYKREQVEPPRSTYMWHMIRQERGVDCVPIISSNINTICRKNNVFIGHFNHDCVTAYLYYWGKNLKYVNASAATRENT